MLSIVWLAKFLNSVSKLFVTHLLIFPIAEKSESPSLTGPETKSAETSKSSEDKQKLSTIRIKIAPQADPDHPEPVEPSKAPSSKITLEQFVEEENPIWLKVNDKPVDSKDKFETVVKYPETIDIIINSPASEAEIRLPGESPESSTASPKATPLADTPSTASGRYR